MSTVEVEEVKTASGGSPRVVGLKTTFATVAAMKASAKLKAGDTASTSNYNAIGDGGGANYIIQTSAEFGGTPDELGDHSMTSGLVAALVVVEPINVKQLGVVGNGTTDDTAAFQNAALKYNSIRVPEATYLTKGKISIRDSQSWIMDNPTFTQDGVNFTTVFEADDKADWAILGRTFCKGTLVTSADTGGENGLVVKGGSRYRVEGFTATNMRSHGIHVQVGLLAPAPRGDQGQYTDCAANVGRVGIEIDPGASAEFNVFSNFNANGNLDGAIIGAGNSTFIGGNIVDNTQGVSIIAGSNHAHGIFSGTNINHNNTFNLKFISVTNGHTFAGCHFFGNGGATAPIIFENSKGGLIIGGLIDCAIRNDGTTGQNAIINNYIPTTTPALFGTNPEFLRILGNFTDTGSWNINDFAAEYTLVSRGTSTQSIAPGTTLIFNSATKDKRTLMNLSTGVYTAPIAAVYRVKLNIKITGTGFTAAGASFVDFEQNGAIVGSVPIVPISDTVAFCSGTIDVLMAATDTFEVVSQAAGTAPVLAITFSTFAIETV